MSLKPLFAAGLLAATFLPLRAAVFVTNLGNPAPFAYGVGQTAGGGADFAVAFTAGSYATLNAVSLGLRGTFADGGGFSVSLYHDTSGVPGASLATLSGSDHPATEGTYTYTDAANTLLSAGTTYWIVASTPHDAGSTGYFWYLTQDLTVTAEPGWAATSYAVQSFDAGGNPYGWSAYSDGRFLLSVDATAAVPEPTTYAVAAGLALVGFAVWRKK